MLLPITQNTYCCGIQEIFMLQFLIFRALLFELSWVMYFFAKESSTKVSWDKVFHQITWVKTINVMYWKYPVAVV